LNTQRSHFLTLATSHHTAGTARSKPSTVYQPPVTIRAKEHDSDYHADDKYGGVFVYLVLLRPLVHAYTAGRYSAEESPGRAGR